MKAPVFSFEKLSGMDVFLSPEMKSTGEAIGYDAKLSRAMYKALVASGIKMQNYGTKCKKGSIYFPFDVDFFRT